MVSSSSNLFGSLQNLWYYSLSPIIIFVIVYSWKLTLKTHFYVEKMLKFVDSKPAVSPKD